MTGAVRRAAVDQCDNGIGVRSHAGEPQVLAGAAALTWARKSNRLPQDAPQRAVTHAGTCLLFELVVSPWHSISTALGAAAREPDVQVI